MRRNKGPLLVPLFIAVVCVGLIWFLQWFRPSFVVPLDIAASDYLLLRPDGPQLGVRPTCDDIVLVMADATTLAERDGRLPDIDEQLRLYRRLLGAGVRVVADTHMLAASDEQAMEYVRPLLKGMREIESDGSLMRDIWTPANTPLEEQLRWAPCIAPVVMNMHPSANSLVDSRLCPLVTFMGAGPVETMPLRIVRAFHRLAPLETVAVDAQLLRCDIFVSWSERESGFEYRTQSPPCYLLGLRQVHWYQFPSQSPLVPPAAFWIAYDASPVNYRRLSYHDVLAGEDISSLDGKIVIIGTDARIDPTGQTYTIPVSLEKVSIAEVTAAAVQTVLNDRYIRQLPGPLQLGIAWCWILGITFAAARLRPAWAVIATLGLVIGYLALVAFLYQHGWFLSALLVPAIALLAAALGGAYQLFLARRSRMRIVDLFGRYVPRAVVQQLVQKPEVEALIVGGVRRNVSVLFADIRGFTTFSETLDPEKVLVELNSLLEGMVGCTFAAEGTLDKFIGDAILVLFNAPLDQPDHSRRAVATALEIQAAVAHHPSGLAIGIGIHSGEAVVGNIGTPERMEYTAIGSTVNIASRLCDVACAGEIVVTRSMAEQLQEEFVFEERVPVRVKGIEHELNICTVTGKCN